MANIVWFRSDLRITDNPALAQARQDKTTRAIFIVCKGQWHTHDWGNNKIAFVLACIDELRVQLASLEISLDILECDNFKQVPKLLLDYCKKHSAHALYYNYEYELNEQLRDQQVTQVLESSNIKVHVSHDQCLIPPGIILTQQAKPYTVFSPFKRACYAYLAKQKFKITNKYRSTPQKLLANFCTDKITAYKQQRDFPAIDGTSKLSAYLATGAISVRECFVAAQAACPPELALPWIDELLWRDFYRNIIFHFPDICKGYNFNRKYDNIPWQEPGINLQRWQDGHTGVPLVDAAMRQLVATGWMHNRLRMVVAMFLTKNLLIDWRHGEKFFAKYLNDLDFASNNGGWQWSASTGTDAVPYFRIFNPLTQSVRFDPEAIFIKQYCPELNKLSVAAIHNPDPKTLMVDLKSSRARAIAAYKGLH